MEFEVCKIYWYTSIRVGLFGHIGNPFVVGYGCSCLELHGSISISIAKLWDACSYFSRSLPQLYTRDLSISGPLLLLYSASKTGSAFFNLGCKGEAIRYKLKHTSMIDVRMLPLIRFRLHSNIIYFACSYEFTREFGSFLKSFWWSAKILFVFNRLIYTTIFWQGTKIMYSSLVSRFRCAQGIKCLFPLFLKINLSSSYIFN